MASVLKPRDAVIDYLTDLLLPAFNEWRAAGGIEPAPPPPHVTAEQAHAAAVELEARETAREGREPHPIGVRRRRAVRAPPPEGLRTAAEAATKLGCSIKTIDGYVKAGALKYVALGHGKKRQRRMFADSDLTEFIQAQTRKDSPCPSTRTRTVDHRSTITTSGSKVVGFMEARSKRRNAKPKR